MSIDRRKFLVGVGAAAAGAALGSTSAAEGNSPLAKIIDEKEVLTWPAVREQFDSLSKDHIHLSSFFLASHPRVVRDEIEKHRRAIDNNPFVYIEENIYKMPGRIQEAVSGYMGTKPTEIGLTNSTTMGLALVYQGLPLKAGQEILTTKYDHFIHHETIRLVAEKTGATVKKIALFDGFDSITQDGIVARIKAAITTKTRILGITWVHSSTGLKLPLRAIAAMIAEVNKTRDEADRIISVVDGVHGFGVEDETIPETGIDFFCAGTHKWIFGPRGTGIVWAKADNWKQLNMVFPAFTMETVTAWLTDKPFDGKMTASSLGMGGFHSFEYEWALPAAFAFHKHIGRDRVAERIHALNDQCKEGLAAMKNIALYTPRGNDLAAGLICFDVNGIKAEEVVKRLLEKRIVASTAPYRDRYVRLAPSLINTPNDIETALRSIRNLN